MNEKITAHPSKEEREKVLKEIWQLENRKKILENKQRNEERRVRTRRLIERGAILEGIFPLAPNLSGAEVKAFLIALSHLPGAAELTAHHRRENPFMPHCGGYAGTLRDRNGRSIYEYFQRKEVPDMNEKITAHPQKEEREEVLKEIRQLENRKKILENKQRNEERRVRTRRLIERGAILEGIFPLASNLSGAEVKAFLITLSHLPGAAELTANLPKSGDTP